MKIQLSKPIIQSQNLFQSQIPKRIEKDNELRFSIEEQHGNCQCYHVFNQKKIFHKSYNHRFGKYECCRTNCDCLKYENGDIIIKIMVPDLELSSTEESIEEEEIYNGGIF